MQSQLWPQLWPPSAPCKAQVVTTGQTPEITKNWPRCICCALTVGSNWDPADRIFKRDATKHKQNQGKGNLCNAPQTIPSTKPGGNWRSSLLHTTMPADWCVAKGNLLCGPVLPVQGWSNVGLSPDLLDSGLSFHHSTIFFPESTRTQKWWQPPEICRCQINCADALPTEHKEQTPTPSDGGGHPQWHWCEHSCCH